MSWPKFGRRRSTHRIEIGASPRELLALLLLAVPSVFTMQKLLLLLLFGDRSHTSTAEPGYTETHPMFVLRLAQHFQLPFQQRLFCVNSFA